MVNLVDMLHQDGVENPSGLATIHGIALISDFATIQKAPALTDVGATAATVGVIGTAHTFVSTKCMMKIYGTENKGDAKDDVVGDIDSQGSKGSGVLMLPGSSAVLNGSKRILNNAIGILFIQEADGQIRQYGSLAFPCHFKMNYASGNNEGYRGYTLTWTNYGGSFLYTPGLNFTPAA